MTAIPITMRADPDVKALFEQICAEIGLSVNAALNIFVKRVVRDRKPEPLKGNLQGFWSRRIDEANRLIYYRSSDGALCIIACRGHYE